MTTIDFPSSPSNGDIHTIGIVNYEYNATKGYWFVSNYENPPTGYTGSQGALGYTGSQGVIGYTGSAANNSSIFKAYGTSTSSIANVSADLTWSTPVISTSDISLSSNELTINTAGVYQFTLAVRTDNSNRTELILRTYINGTEQTNDVASDYIARDADQNTGGITHTVTFDLSASDVVKFDALGDCDGACTILTAGTFLTAVKLS